MMIQPHFGATTVKPLLMTKKKDLKYGEVKMNVESVTIFGESLKILKCHQAHTIFTSLVVSTQQVGKITMNSR
jgi:hypothetical protein